MAHFNITGVINIQYLLVLNNMTGRMEDVFVALKADTVEELKQMYLAEVVDTYSDEGPDNFNGGMKKYNKSFRKGGPLEWCNRVDDVLPLTDPNWGKPDDFAVGIHEDISMIKHTIIGPAY